MSRWRLYRSVALWLGWMLLPIGLIAQSTETDIKIYNFTDGLSHRNVFSIEQDAAGLIWLSTINGLNSFDGYGFKHYDREEAFDGLELISHLAVKGDSLLYATAPDYLIRNNLHTGAAQRFKLKKGAIKRRDSTVPTALTAGSNGGVFLILQKENSGKLSLSHFLPGRDSLPRSIATLGGQYNQRPLVTQGDTVYCGAFESELWLLDGRTGDKIGQYDFPPSADGSSSRIIDLQTGPRQLWVLLDDGRVFHRPYGSNSDFALFEHQPPGQGNWQSFFVSATGDIYLGGFGALLVWDNWKKHWEDLDAPIRQLVKNTCTYRDIQVDLSGTIWVASDFGAIRLTRSDRLFTQYLSGGSEYCSNVYCSTRGITEDEQGRIYISYYNSIHVLDPISNNLRPLFPANDYFNYPYGLHYYNGHLYTGDGGRIRLSDLKIDQLFPDDGESEGAITQGQDSIIWFGYDRQLLYHNPLTDSTGIYRNHQGKSWTQLTNSVITYLVSWQDWLFVGTMQNGLFQLHLETDELRHWHQDSTQNSLNSNRINSIYLHKGQGGDYRSSNSGSAVGSNADADSSPQLFLATANGLHRIDLPSGEVTLMSSQTGAALPNDYLNGILPEGDSVLWVSTDHGLCRFSLQTENCVNFFTTDGLSSDEFNRISFFRSQNGRMYFGGLNGVNAFRPEPRFLTRREEKMQVPLMVTSFSYVDGGRDTLITLDQSDLSDQSHFNLSHRDRQFNFTFSLADYRSPNQNRYSYFLEGYDHNWSTESTDYNLRFSDLPPGSYVLHVKARVAKEDWMNRQLSIPIVVRQPYYYKWWFWASLMGLVLLIFFGILRFRIYRAEQQRLELEKTVKKRTAELAAEKQKSEELLLNILPAQTAKELLETGRAKAYRHEQVTVFFSDFVSFTAVANQLEPEVLVTELDHCFRTFDEIVASYQLEKIKTIGDAYLFIGGHQGNPQQAAIDSVRAARDIQAFLRSHAATAKVQQRPHFRARIGLHSGPIVAGVVGTHKFAYDIWGETVNIAARMESNGIPEGIVVSDATYKLIRSEFACRPYKTFTEHGVEVKMWMVE